MQLLRESEARFRETFELAAIGIAHIALDGRWLRVNDRLCAIAGYPREELLARTFQEITYGPDLAGDLDAVRRLIAGELLKHSVEKRYVRGDGSLIWVNVTVALARNASGEPSYFITMVEDIDARKAVELALQESRAHLRDLTESLPQLIFTSDPNGRCTYLNQRWVEYTGRSIDESLGLGWATSFHPDDQSETSEGWAEAISFGETREREFRLRAADGSYRWFLSRIVPVRNAAGEIVQWFGSSMDIDERKRAADLLERSERLFRSLSAATAQVIWLTDAEGMLDDASAIAGIDSSLWTSYTGQTADESRGLGWIAAVHPDDRERVGRAWRDAIARGEPFTLEYRVRRHDGAWRVMIDRGVPVRNAVGTIEQWIGTGSDVTAEREAEAVVRESEARLRRLFDANIFGVIFWSAEGPITQANDAFLAIIGATRTELESGAIDWRTITPPEWSEADEHALAEIQATGACTPYEKAYRRRDGSEVPVMVASTAFVGRSEGIGVVFDLTERKVQERFEQEFLAGIAHDIKNPLAAMKAQAQLMHRRLRGGRLSEESAAEGLLAIDGNATRVAYRLDELTDTALLRSGHLLELAREPVDLVALATARAETYRQTTERHQIVVLTRDKPLVGIWDASRIERAIDNLFSNAIKYSPRGGVVQVELRREADGPRDWATLTITDEGVGIPAGDLPHVFTRFARGSNVTGQMQGTGIGLAGVRLLIEQHGGTIDVESIEGEGSTFVLRLPLSW
ncbi:MAG: PAS domain S-box protein [Thermomicrobiales bacterium]|nr:PAS domain S-box protein [Thermomicrobiales bacterium]